MFFPPAAFHINSGKPLFNHPLVASALSLLELAKPRIDHANAGAILRSPFINGAASERSLRALADLDLRKRRELYVSLRDLTHASKHCPELLLLWSSLGSILRDRPDIQDLSRWSEWMGDILAAMGWPGNAELSDAENAIVEAWNDALSNLSALGLVCPPQTYDAAVAQLRRLLASEIEQGDWFAPIQVLDAKNAAGLEFDHAIVVGLSDETWPPVVSLSPLIPFALQRIPELSDVRQQRRALTRALFESAPAVTASYSGSLAIIAKSA